VLVFILDIICFVALIFCMIKMFVKNNCDKLKCTTGSVTTTLGEGRKLKYLRSIYIYIVYIDLLLSLTTTGIRCADHATPSIRKTLH
jgi:hypothetical protein